MAQLFLSGTTKKTKLCHTNACEFKDSVEPIEFTVAQLCGGAMEPQNPWDLWDPGQTRGSHMAHGAHGPQDPWDPQVLYY